MKKTILWNVCLSSTLAVSPNNLRRLCSLLFAQRMRCLHCKKEKQKPCNWRNFELMCGGTVLLKKRPSFPTHSWFVGIASFKNDVLFDNYQRQRMKHSIVLLLLLSTTVSLFVCLFGWLVVWLFGCLVVWLFGCLVVWLVGWLAGWLVGWLVRWLVRWCCCSMFFVTNKHF